MLFDSRTIKPNPDGQAKSHTPKTHQKLTKNQKTKEQS